MNQTQKDMLIRFLENRKELDVPGNALLIRRGNEEIFRHFAGDAAPDTLFRVYSMTKVITVTAAFQLLEQGKFTMEDPVSKFLPEFGSVTVWDEAAGRAVPAERPILIRDLFCMTAGLTYAGTDCETSRRVTALTEEMRKEYPGRSYTTREFVRRLAGVPLCFQPGIHWRYSLCHDVLGALIEVLTGESFGDYLKKHIFDPLGMEHTFFHCPPELMPRMASFQDAYYNDQAYMPEARYESGGGGLLSTADDYMRFASVLTAGGTGADGVRILSRKTIDLMRTDQLSSVQKQDYNWRYLKGYSYGFGVRTLLSPGVAGIPGSEGEFGWCGVLGTWVLMDPSEQLTVVYMHQRMPNLEAYLQTHLRAMIYGTL